MTKQDILEAILIHSTFGDCAICPYAGKMSCTRRLMADVQTLIDKQDKQIEMLNNQLENVKAERDRARGAGMVRG